MSYFRKFPLIEYNGRQVRNITARTALTAKSLLELEQAQTYLLPQGVRAPELAFDYYGRPEYVWLLFFANNIVDPYYDWTLDEEMFREYIIKKYGSITNAQEGIAFYKINWESDTTKLTSAGYNALPAERKYYWTVDTQTELGEVTYKRKPLNQVINTNKTIELKVDNTENFIIDERVNQYSGFTLVASGQISKIINSTSMLVEKITGAFTNTSITGSQSIVTANVTDSITLAENITSDLSVYWTPVTYLEYEESENDRKRSINVIDKSVQSFVDDTVTQLLRNE